MQHCGDPCWLVTGGAGYIGAHVVRKLAESGFKTVIVDNLSSGTRSSVPVGAKFYEVDILNTGEMASILNENRCSGVIHLAGFKYAGVSVSRPLHTYRQNVCGTLSILEAMVTSGVRNLVFSSSAGVYGSPGSGSVLESFPTEPDSPYGESKLACELLIKSALRAGLIKATCLRYFNVAGTGYRGLSDRSPHNLFPKIFDRLRNGEAPLIFGCDYETPDGTCVRDYVHVSDIARAHVMASKALENGSTLKPIYNLGSGSGYSVREVVEAACHVSGRESKIIFEKRREGDPAYIVADASLVKQDLGWVPELTLHDMLNSSWADGL